jgi:coatomer subunit beta
LTGPTTTMEKSCTIFVLYDAPERASPAEIRKQLQEGDVYEKRDALKKAILLISNGELLPNVLMTVIQYVMPSKDHELKKLMILYWEVIPKKAADGKLLPEMILVCNSLRNDLNHPNEYIRGATLRFLCKLKEAELLVGLGVSLSSSLFLLVSCSRCWCISLSLYRSFLVPCFLSSLLYGFV